MTPHKKFSMQGQDEERKIQHPEIKKELVNYFKNLLMEKKMDRQLIINIFLYHIPMIINHEQNFALMRLIYLEEVEVVVMDMPINKAPILYGFTTYFF